MYGICRRIKEEIEGGDRLKIIMLSNPHTGEYDYTIMETCDDGVERLVLKCGPGHRINALDGRVIEKLKWMLKKPLQARIDEFEAWEDEVKAAQRELEKEELYERIGRPMLTDLEKCGFITRPVSYPKKGIKPTNGNDTS